MAELPVRAGQRVGCSLTTRTTISYAANRRLLRSTVYLLEDGSALVTWVEYAEGASDFKVRRVDKAGVKSPALAVAPVSGGRASGFPRVARRGNELIFAWSGSATPEGDAEGSLQVFTAVATLP